MKTMRLYYYNEPDGEYNNVIVRMTRQEILNEYWDFWYNKMVEKYGEGHELIKEDNCIEDWVVTHWAWIEEYELDQPEQEVTYLTEEEAELLFTSESGNDEPNRT
jgi:hypothetical protein